MDNELAMSGSVPLTKILGDNWKVSSWIGLLWIKFRGKISTAGILTLSGDLLCLPVELVEYVVVHELLHLKFPDHRRGWRVSMGMYLSDWQERAYRLLAYTVGESE